MRVQVRWLAGVCTAAFIAGAIWLLWVWGSHFTSYPEIQDEKSGIGVSFTQPVHVQSINVTFGDHTLGRGAGLNLGFDSLKAGTKITLSFSGPVFTNGQTLGDECLIQAVPKEADYSCSVVHPEQPLESYQVIEETWPSAQPGVSVEVPGHWAAMGSKSEVFSLAGIATSATNQKTDIPGIGTRYAVSAAHIGAVYFHTPITLPPNWAPTGGMNTLTPHERMDSVNPSPVSPGFLNWTSDDQTDMGLNISGSITDLNREGQQLQGVFWLGIAGGLLTWAAERFYKLSAAVIGWRVPDDDDVAPDDEGENPQKRRALRRTAARRVSPPRWKHRRSRRGS